MQSARTYRPDHASPMRQVWIAIIGLAAGRARGAWGRLEQKPPHKAARGGY
jgi:hypothetical protein